MTAPTPTQIAEWFKQGAATFLKDKHAATFNTPDYFYASGYLRARTEQATEIAALKAQIAELSPLANRTTQQTLDA
jgi:hypothetical protein